MLLAITDYMELSVAAANMQRPLYKLTPDMEKKVKYIHDTIHDELNTESPKVSTEREALKVIFRVTPHSAMPADISVVLLFMLGL